MSDMHKFRQIVLENEIAEAKPFSAAHLSKLHRISENIIKAHELLATGIAQYKEELHTLTDKIPDETWKSLEQDLYNKMEMVRSDMQEELGEKGFEDFN